MKTATPTAEKKENAKPESSTANLKASEEPKHAVTEPSPMSLALRQVGQEAAQKAKDNKKAAVQTYLGVGKAEPVKEEKEKSTPAPISTAATDKNTVDSLSSLQSPNSTAWKTAPTSMATALSPPGIDKLDSLRTPNSTSSMMTNRGSTISDLSEEINSQPGMDKLESLQSPNSTSWKPTDVDKPVLTHRGSTISDASEEEIKQIEEEETIQEESDEDDEEDEDEEEEKEKK